MLERELSEEAEECTQRREEGEEFEGGRKEDETYLSDITTPL